MVDPAENAAKQIKQARKEMERARRARQQAAIHWRRAKEGYNETLRTAIARLDAYGQRSTKEIAALLGVPPSTVSDVRQGRR